MRHSPGKLVLVALALALVAGTSRPDKDAAAEALFFPGVAKYKLIHDPKPLREAYDELQAKFPQSTWAKQADHYRLISK